MRKSGYFKGKSLAVLLSVILLLAAVAAGTVAYIHTKTEPVTNTFEAVQVSCTVTESSGSYTVNNTSDIAAYLRAAVVVNWTDASGNNVYWKQPVFTVTHDKDWELCKDGFYYYKPTVASKDSASALTVVKDKEANDKITVPDGYTLTVQVLAEAIQSVPAEAVQAAWPVTVNNDGKLNVPTAATP